MAVILAFLASATMAVAQPGVQTLTAEDLAQAGVTRLSDIFELARGWSAFSTEEFHWDVAPLGVTWETSTRWMVFVDENSVDMRALGRQSINDLPLSLSEVCTVKLYTLPVVIGGQIAPSGAIQLQTCSVPRGLSARGVLGAGNETGDPGPWRYTAFGGPNVDRTGPTLQGAFAVGGGNWHLRAQAKLDEHHATDERIRTRARTLYVGEKDARIIQKAGRVDLRMGTLTLLGAAGRTEDLRFSETLGVEAPINHETAYFGAAGTSRILGYRMSARRSRVLTRTNPASVNLDFEQDALSAQLYGRFKLNDAHFELGARGWHLRTIPQPVQEERRFILGSTYGRWNARIGARLTAFAHGSYEFERGGPGFSAFGSLSLAPGGLQLTLFANNRTYASHNDLAYWLSQGYDPTYPGSIPLQSKTEATRGRMLSADLSWHRRGEAELILTAGYRHHGNYQLVSYSTSYDSLTTGLAVATGIASVAGGALRGAVELRMPVGPAATALLHATYAYVMADQHEYRSAWHLRVVAYGQLDFRPNPRFSLHTRLRYRGASDWHGFTEAARVAPEHYALSLPAALLVDISAQKRLWGEQLRLSATLRNLADHLILTHPAGSWTRLSFHVRFQYRFSSVTE